MNAEQLQLVATHDHAHCVRWDEQHRAWRLDLRTIAAGRTGIASCRAVLAAIRGRGDAGMISPEAAAVLLAGFFALYLLAHLLHAMVTKALAPVA